jgi:Helix-turn-helix of DDE superfamily endonuclease
MHKQIKKIVFLVTSTSIMSLSLPQVSIAAPKGFKTPSGNIFCELIEGNDTNTNSLRCEIASSLKPKPPQPYPGYCEFDWGCGRKPKLLLPEQIILTLVYLRHLTTFQLLGIQFGVSKSTANSTFNYWLPLLRELLPSSVR